MTLLSSLRFGILLGRKDTTVLPLCITGMDFIVKGIHNCIQGSDGHVTLLNVFLHIFFSPARGAQAAIVVYDITNQDTFGRAKVWVKELQRQASPNIVIALAGNKADLAAKRAVEFEEAKSYAEENGLLFMETSAKTAMNVNDIFLAIGRITIEKKKQQRNMIRFLF